MNKSHTNGDHWGSITDLPDFIILLVCSYSGKCLGLRVLATFEAKIATSGHSGLLFSKYVQKLRIFAIFASKVASILKGTTSTEVKNLLLFKQGVILLFRPPGVPLNIKMNRAGVITMI